MLFSATNLPVGFLAVMETKHARPFLSSSSLHLRDRLFPTGKLQTSWIYFSRTMFFFTAWAQGKKEKERKY